MGFFFGGGASVDLASPSAIGSTTPNTGAFTTLSVSGAISSTSTLNWHYRIGGSSALSGIVSQYNLIKFFLNNNETIAFSSTEIYFSKNFSQDSSQFIGWASDTKLFRDGAANALAQRNGTTAQTFRIYNTFTDASNYERGFLRWTTNVLEIGAEAAGTGTQRQLRFPLGTVTASTPLSITQTWNSAGVTFTGLQLNATDTASASGSLLMDLQVGGVSQFTFRKNGIACLRFGFAAGSDVGIECYSINDSAMSRTVSARCNMLGSTSSGLRLSSGHAVSWSSNNGSTADVFQNNDLFILRDASNILAQRNSTNAQAFKLYRTFTDASNYERLGILTTNTTRYTITSENAGTGSARSLEVSFYTAASDPTSTDITSGCFSVWKNSGTGTIKLWANDGGTMKSVALA